MKKYVLLIVALVGSSSAFASKARYEALQRARTTKQDFVEMFQQPSVMWSGEIADQALYENGTAGFLMSHGDESKYGIYLGEQAVSLSLLSSPFNVAPFTSLDNPLHFFYGRDMGGFKWAFNIYYANTNTKDASPNDYEKAATGVAFGVNGDGWRVDLSSYLNASIKDTDNNNEASLKGDLRVQLEYDLSDNLRLYVDLAEQKKEFKTPTPPTTTAKVSTTLIGIERRMGKEANTFFYGLAYNATTIESGSIKIDITTLPLYFGVEAEALSWLLLRASVNQPVLIASIKTGNAISVVPGPTYAAGAGLRLGNFLLDGGITLGGNSNSTLNTSSLMTNVAVTYNF